MPKYLGPPFTAAGSGKEKEKQTPRENVETVSDGVAQRQCTPLFKKNGCIQSNVR